MLEKQRQQLILDILAEQQFASVRAPVVPIGCIRGNDPPGHHQDGCKRPAKQDTWWCGGDFRDTQGRPGGPRARLVFSGGQRDSRQQQAPDSRASR